MTNMTDLQSMNIDELTEWLDEYGQFDGSPWMEWFDNSYCKKCEPIMCHYKDSEVEFPCSYCELEHKCRYFSDMSDIPNNKDIIRMWLMKESDRKK